MPDIQETICSGNRRYRAQEPLNPVGVVLHSIGTPQPDAQVLHDLWARDGSPYVVHYVLDDRIILHTMPDNLKCWHVCSPGNAKWLGIEMCEPSQINYSGGADFTVSGLDEAQNYAEACYKNAVSLLARLCTQYGWDPLTSVWTHYEVTRQHLSNTDHVDPQHLWDGLGMDYDLLTLRRDVAAAMGSAAPAAPAAPETPAASTDTIYRVRSSWDNSSSQVGAYHNLDYAIKACPDGYGVYDGAGNLVYQRAAAYVVRVTARSGLNVRKGPGTDYGVAMSVPYGGAYTITEERDGWGRLKSGAGWICLQYTDRV